MIKIVLAVAIVAVLAFVGVNFASRSVPLRGLARIPQCAQPVLVSRARDPIVFVPAADMVLQEAGWRDIDPPTNQSEDGDARGWFALYLGERGVLTTAILDAQDSQRWEWERGHHPPYPTRVLRDWEDSCNGETGYFLTMLLDEKTDPFWPCLPKGTERSVVFRMKFLVHFWRMQVIVEYREPVPTELVTSIKVEDAWLHAFMQRGMASCAVLFPSREEAEALKGTITKMTSLDKAYSRRTIAKWAGEMRRRQE